MGDGAHFVTCSDDRSLRIWTSGKGTVGANGAASDVSGNPQPVKSVAAAAFLMPLFRSMTGSVPAAQSTSINTRSEPRVPPSDAACQWGCIASVDGQHPRSVY